METETKTEAARGEGVAFAGHIKRESQQNPQTEMVDDRLRALHAAVEEEQQGKKYSGKGKSVLESMGTWAFGMLLWFARCCPALHLICLLCV